MSLFGDIFKKPKTDAIYEIKSPNGQLDCVFVLDHGQISYFVKKNDKVVLRKSRLGLVLKDMTPMADNFAVVRAYTRTIDETWKAEWGEQHIIRNNYNETAIYLEEYEKPNRLLTLRFRVYDDGFAIRYEIPAQPEMKNMVVADELTEFSVDTNSRSWSIPAYQPDRYEYDYVEHPVYTLTDSVHTPLTIQSTSGHFFFFF